jgi:hypothetical protein
MIHKFLLGVILFLFALGSLQAAMYGPAPSGIILAGYARNIDLNAIADTPLTITLPPGTTKWRVSQLTFHNDGPLASLTTAKVGVFTEVAGAGTAIVATNTALTTVTSNTINTAANTTAINPSITIVLDLQTIYFRVTTAQGAPATGSVYLFVLAIP